MFINILIARLIRRFTKCYESRLNTDILNTSQRRVSGYDLANGQWEITWQTLNTNVLPRQSLLQNVIDISSASRACCSLRGNAFALSHIHTHTYIHRIRARDQVTLQSTYRKLKINEPFLPFHWKSFRRVRSSA